MTDDQVNALDAYVKRLQEAMRLTHWVVLVQAKWASKDKLATIHTTAGRYVACLWVSRSFWKRPSEDQRNTITHELIHLTHSNVTDEVRLGEYRQQLGQVMYDALHTNVLRHVEMMVDHLAGLLAPTMPLPAWPKGVG